MPDVPQQYKVAVDRNVLQIMHSAEDLVAISGELGGVTVEIESEDIEVKILRKRKGGYMVHYNNGGFYFSVTNTTGEAQEIKIKPLTARKRPVTIEYCIAPSKGYISTPEGVMQYNKGELIIKGVNGELYPCKPDIFEKTYEVVDGKSE